MRSRINSSCPKADVKGKNNTSSWLIVRLPLVSYVKVTYGSNIIILISNIRVNTLYYICIVKKNKY